MGVPSTNIKLSADIAAAQLGLTGVIKMTDVYVTSTAAGTVFSGSYHNVSIGVGTPDYYANKIYQPYAIMDKLALGNWAGYDHQHNNVFSWNIQNNSPNDYTVNFYISATPATYQFLFWSVTVMGFGGQSTQTDFDTGVNAYNFSGTPGDPYYIDCEVLFAGGPGVPGVQMVVQSSSDSDAVGAGTARVDYTSTFGPWSLAPVTGLDFTDVLITGSPWKVNGIPWNKRTSVDILIQ